MVFKISTGNSYFTLFLGRSADPYIDNPIRNYMKCPGYDIKLHLVVRLQSWSSRGFKVPLHCHYSQVHSNSEW